MLLCCAVCGWDGWAARELDCSQTGEGLAVVRDGVVVEIELKQGYADWKGREGARSSYAPDLDRACLLGWLA